MMNVQPEFYS